MPRVSAIFLVFMNAAFASASLFTVAYQEQAKKPTRQPDARAAIALAAADLATLPEYDRMYARYLWVRSGSYKRYQALCIAANYLSTAPVPTQLLPLGKDALLVARLDVRLLTTEYTRSSFIETFEELQFDPAFNLLFTKDTLKFNFGVEVAKTKKAVKKKVDKLVEVEPYTAADGKQYSKKWIVEEETEFVEVDPLRNGDDVIRQVNPALDLQAVAFLVEWTRSQAPIVTDGYFIARGLRQVQDKGLYKSVYSGLYYRFVGIKQGAKKGTDEDVAFENLGIGSVKEGITVEDVFGKFRSDSRVVTARSGVTERSRQSEFLPILSANPATSMPFISRTHDLARENIDIGGDPLMNLIKFKDDGREAIFVKSNGFHGFWAANGQGAIVDQVPDTIIAGDKSLGGNSVEEPAISCISCHAQDGGWRKITNDVRKIVGSGLFDIVNDFTARSKLPKTHQDNIDRIVGLYRNDPELLLLPKARNDLANAYLLACGRWEGGKNQTNIVQDVGAELVAAYREYVINPLDAVNALRDCGFDVDGLDAEKAGKKLKEILPALQVEDVRLIVLMENGTLQRSQFDLSIGFLLARLAAAGKLDKQ